MILSLFYKFYRYLQIFSMLLNPKHMGRRCLRGRYVYFNNVNTFTILEKNIEETAGIREKLYKDSDCFIDAGAHIGIKSILYNSINENSPVFSFEPVRETYNLLKINTEGIKNLQIHNFGLGEKDCVKKIYVNRAHLDISSLNENHSFLKDLAENTIEGQQIQIKRLDDFKEYFEDRNKIFLKIDVESYEDRVLEGAREIIPKVKYLDIEISQSSDKFLSQILNKLTRKYNILDVDFFTHDSEIIPRAVNLLLELYE